jgi:hypothetical protein
MNHRTRISAALVALLAVVALAAGCRDAAPTEVELRPDGLRVGSVAQAVILPFRQPAQWRSKVIGPAGGVVRFGSGEIVFPAGAIARPTRITATVESSRYAVTFEPHGLTFPNNARPSLRFNIRGVAVAPARLQVAYVRNSGTVLELLQTDINPNSASATAPLDHFSTYVMGAH